MTSGEVPTEEAWNDEALADRLTDELGRIVDVRGIGSAALRQRLEALREAFDRRETMLLPVDPTGSAEVAETLREVTAEYVRRAGSVSSDGEIQRLLELATDVRQKPGESATEAVGRRAVRSAITESWGRLSRQQSAVLLVLHPEEMGPDDRRTLEALVEAHFVDAVGSLVPELDVRDTVDFSIVVGTPRADLSWDVSEAHTATVDVSGAARRAIREQLADDEVVDQFVASTGGDPERLSELVEALPDNCESFWQFRYRALDGQARTLVDTLAVAGRPLPASTLRAILERLGAGTFESTRARQLCRDGYLRRRFDGGTMQLELADVDLRRGLVEAMERDRRVDFHRAIAEAGAEEQVARLDDEFLARHFLEAGDIASGFEYGVRAARTRYATHALESARDLFERLLARGESTDSIPASELDRIRWYLVDIATDLGDTDAALAHAETLEARLEDRTSRWTMRRRQAELRSQTGAHEEAERIVEELRADIDSGEHPVAWAATVQVGAEAAYARGLQDRAESLADEALAGLDAEADDESAADTRVDARNLLGRIALFRGECERARELFEQNRAAAREWNWPREVTRAELNLGILDVQAGRFEAAVETMEALLERSPAPTPQRRAHLLVNLGMAHQRRGCSADALEAYRGAFRAGRRADDDVSTGIAAYNLATLCQDFGAYDRVLRLVDWMQQRQLDEKGPRFGGTLPELLTANALLEKGDYDRALEALESAAGGDDASSVDALPAARIEIRAALAHVYRGELDRARERLNDADRPEGIENDAAVAGLRRLGRALLAVRDGEAKRAAELATRAREELADEGYFQDSLRAALVRVDALADLGRREEAGALVERCLVDFQDRAESVPSEFQDPFHAIPTYRRLAERARELIGELPEGFRAPSRSVSADGETGGPPEPREADVRRWREQFPAIVGRDQALIQLLGRIEQVADSDSPVLIQGESGTGKELVAEALHRESARGRAGEPFVKVNCGAFVDNLLLSELFGHVAGAFTGAVEQKVGCFDRADGGTIFLDEIGEISQKAQVALLRALQEGEFEPVGGTETHSVDVRVVCATNRDLAAMVDEETFRLDLYYRLKGVLLETPPLRERRGDIPLLARHFAREAADTDAVDFSPEALEFLASYRWPGNVRELRNLVETVLLFVDEDRVEMEHLREFGDFFADEALDGEAPEIDYASLPVPSTPAEPETSAGASSGGDPEAALVDDVLTGERDLQEVKAALQKQAVRKALEETGGNITQSAEILEMSRPRVSQIVNGDDDLLALKEQLVA